MNIKYFKIIIDVFIAIEKKLLNKNQTHIDNFYIEAIKSDLNLAKSDLKNNSL